MRQYTKGQHADYGKILRGFTRPGERDEGNGSGAASGGVSPRNSAPRAPPRLAAAVTSTLVRGNPW